MNAQMSLFASEPAGPRRIDPKTLAKRGQSTSKKAAEKLVDSGNHKAQMEIVLIHLRENPGVTSLELAERAGMDRYVVARRLPDLLKQGLVRQCAARKCRIGGSSAMTWEAVK